MIQSSSTNANILQQFVDWTKRKIKHHFDEPHRDIYFYEGQVWWAALGKNVGCEMDGKHAYFSRPVFILKKYSSSMCFVVPLTTQIKDGNPPYQYIFNVGGKRSAVNLSQGRTISSQRFLQKEYTISQEVLNEVIEKFVALLKG